MPVADLHRLVYVHVGRTTPPPASPELSDSHKTKKHRFGSLLIGEGAKGLNKPPGPRASAGRGVYASRGITSAGETFR